MTTNRILIVDDDRTTRKVIELQLKNMEYEVLESAESAEEAIEKVASQNPQLVLMDINLGKGMDGIETARLIIEKYHIPVVYITAYGTDDNLDRAKETNPAGFINKPVRENDLRANIEIAIQRQSFMDTLADVEESSLSEALDHLASGVMLVNEHMKIFYKNKSAGKFFKDNSVLTVENWYLGCKTPEMTAELHHLILKDTGDILTIARGAKKPPLHVFVSPLHSRAANYGQDLPISVIFVFETINDTDRISDVLRTLYSLSPSEAKIAAMLVFNPHLEEIAQSLGITYNTARTHLKRIYLKTGTNRLSSLVHRIMTGPVGIMIHSRD